MVLPLLLAILPYLPIVMLIGLGTQLIISLLLALLSSLVIALLLGLPRSRPQFLDL